MLAACIAAAQTSTPPAGKTGEIKIDSMVKQQFGDSFKVTAGFPTTLATGDLDGDGVEDAVIVADSKDPLPDSYDFKYAVSDPYNGYFGYGNPAVTSAFSTADPRNHDLLVIFGAGAEGWHSATPKAKFVLLNVPFDSIEIGHMLTKKNKPPIVVIKAHESQVMDSAVWWDAKRKRWKWEPGGMG